MIKKKGQKGLVLSLLGVVATALVLSLGLGTTSAMADTGIGTGLGGGSSASGSRWVAGWGPTGTAWNALERNSNLFRGSSGSTGLTFDGTMESLFRNNVTPPSGYNINQFIDLCRNSSVIWWIQDVNSSYRFWGRSYETAMSTNTILSGTNGVAGYDRERADAAAALNSLGNDRARKDVTIVCSSVYTPPVTYKSRTWLAQQGVSTTHTGNLSHTYTETPEFAPNNNLSNQSRTVNTSFKSAFDNTNVNSVAAYNNANSALNTAKTAGDQTPTNNFLPNGDPNRTGLEGGGVLNLATTTSSASITIGYTRNQHLVQYATCDAAGNNCNWPGQPSPSSGYSVVGNYGESWASAQHANTGWIQVEDNGWVTSKSAASTRDSDYYQILSARCNVSWFNDLRNTHPGNETLDTGVSGFSLPNNNVLNTAYRGYTSRPAMPADNTVILGNRGNSTTANNGNAVERSAYAQFYNRPCSEGRWANEQVTVSGTANWDNPYSYRSDIARQPIQGGTGTAVDPIGADNLRDQAGVAGNGYSRTNYGQLRDELAAGSRGNTNIYGLVDAAIAADVNFPTPSIELNAGNRAGMAEGGVLNVFERTAWADLSSYQSDLYYRAMAQTRIYDWNGSAWVAGTWTNNVQDNGANNLNASQTNEVSGASNTRGYPNSLSDRGIAAPGPSASYPCGTSVPNAPGNCVASNVTHAPVTVSIPTGSNETTINRIYTDAAPAANEGWYKKSTTYANSQNLNTPEVTGFWQMMSVHCNPDELQAALAAFGTQGTDYFIVSQVRTDTGVTAVIHTRATPNMPTAAGAKLFGFSSAPVNNPALLRTGNLGFYDKECSLQCTTSPTAGNGASAANGAVNNVSNTGSLTHVDEFGGAISDGTNSNYYEIFRDNKDHRITTNIAYPNVSGTVFSYNGHAPISTTAVLWRGNNVDPASTLNIPEGGSGYPSTGGTPDTSPAGGQLRVSAVGGTGTGSATNEIQLFTGSQAPTTQKNFSRADAAHPVDTYSGPYATQVAGAYNTFDVAATWASLQNRPVVMNVKWEYQPTTSTTVPRTVGFQVNGTQRVDATEARNQAIDVRCYANYGSSSTIVPGGDWTAAKQTGTGVPNVIDTNVLYSDLVNNGSADTTAYRTASNLVIKFVRGVAE